jgi:uncharacterized protein (TIGR02145 family)
MNTYFRVLFIVLVVSLLNLSFSVQMGCHASFPEIKIGAQTWMTQDLNVDKFSNGDAIPQAKSDEEWKKAAEERTPAWCYLENNGAKQGKLYNWFAVNDPRGLAPAGWRIPSIADLETLTHVLEEEGFPGKAMKSNEGWIEEGNGTNESGFDAFPHGSREASGSFSGFGEFGYWWLSNEDKGRVTAWLFTLDYGSPSLSLTTSDKAYGFSVRCVKAQ